MADEKDGRGNQAETTRLAEERGGRAGPGDRSQQRAHAKGEKSSVMKSATKPEAAADNDDM